MTLERDILPILTRAGCNAGACHGKSRGQNGFQLSLLGFDPVFDHDAMTREARGRRIFPPAPEQSLLLLKATAAVPHGGGRRLERGTPAYEAVLRWIAGGTPRTPADAAALVRISVTPAERIMDQGATQRLVVTAHYADGWTEDVTHLAAFQSSESAIVAVEAGGLVKAGPIPGEAAITARYRGLFAGCEVTIPLPGAVPAALYAGLPRANFIDGHVWAKLQRLGITPSEPAGDATFLRRAALDVIGRLPTPEEAREFLADTAPEKRARLVDRLLERPEYADHWANKWMDLLRPNPYRVGIKAVWNLDAWIRSAFRRNLPYDQFVRADRDRAGEHLPRWAGDHLPRPPRARRDRADGEPALPGHPARVCEVPPSPVRVVGPGAVLRVRRLLRAGRPQGDRAVAADLRRRGDRLHGEVGERPASLDRPRRSPPSPCSAPRRRATTPRPTPGRAWPPG